MRAVELRARRLLFERAEGCCEWCGIEGIQYDHRLGRAHIPGYEKQWRLSNAFGLCPPCHKRKTENPMWASDNGLTVFSWQEPGDIAVLRRGVWVKLDDDGGFESV